MRLKGRSCCTAWPLLSGRRRLQNRPGHLRSMANRSPNWSHDDVRVHLADIAIFAARTARLTMKTLLQSFHVTFQQCGLPRVQGSPRNFNNFGPRDWQRCATCSACAQGLGNLGTQLSICHRNFKKTNMPPPNLPKAINPKTRGTQLRYCSKADQCCPLRSGDIWHESHYT